MQLNEKREESAKKRVLHYLQTKIKARNAFMKAEYRSVLFP